MSADEAEALLKECLTVLYYRDKSTMNKFQIARVSTEGVAITEPFALPTNWDYELFVDPAKNATGTW